MELPMGTYLGPEETGDAAEGRKEMWREQSWSLMTLDQTVPEASPVPGLFSDASLHMTLFSKPV